MDEEMPEGLDGFGGDDYDVPRRECPNSTISAISVALLWFIQIYICIINHYYYYCRYISIELLVFISTML